MNKITFPLLVLMLICMIPIQRAMATGEPSTYFNIFVPPNNDKVSRDVCLIVTAIYDSTYFTIKDDSADGDWDDTKTGMLMAGQSYVLYIRNNGVNDDAPHSNESATKQDGDYFIITSNNIVYASQSTDSDWQHDWLPSTNKSSLGQKFIVYAPKVTSSNRDINVMAYEDSTMVTVRKISTVALTAQGYTTVDAGNNEVVLQKMISRGQDLIHFYTEARNLLITGHTYIIETSKSVTVQYGALFGNERDGGGYVPSSNGSSAGELFYFTVPYQVTTEQEIRIVSWDDNNAVVLERYNNGTWVNLQNYNPLNKLKAADWIGKTAGQTFPTVFRVRCTAGKKVSVFEANWLETGSPGTSDIATMVSSEFGTCAGNKFLVYMAPPGNENNVTNPATGLKYNGQFTHAYLFAKNNCTVTVKDAYTNGADINRTYNMLAGRYVDCALDLTEWRKIYNGTGTTAAGPERPYLLVESTDEVSVMTTNFNDNWMMYFGTSLVQDFKQTSSSSSNTAKPGDTVTVVSNLVITPGYPVTNTDVTVLVGDGATPISSTLVNATNNQTNQGTISTSNGNSTITFSNEPNLDPTKQYQVVTKVELNTAYNDGTPIPNNTVVSVETIISGTVNGVTQQSSSSEGITNNAANTSNFYFTKLTTGDVVADSIDTWNGAWFDYDNDNDQDLYISVYNKNLGNILYRNDGNAKLTKITTGNVAVSNYYVSTVSSGVADYDNDGRIDIYTANNLGKTSNLFKNLTTGFGKLNGIDATDDNGYAHGTNWVDYDKDGKLDLFVSEFLPTSFCRLYHNDGSGVLTRVLNNELAQHQNYAIGATWADYDNDGWQDVFIPNGGGPENIGNQNNALFKNNGNGSFTKITTGRPVTDGGNSTASCWGDYDNDGDLDLFVSNASNEVNFLYNNAGNGTFTRILTGEIATDKGNSHGCNWVDFDNDGWLDLFVANDGNQAKFLYKNNGNGTFTKVVKDPIIAASGETFGTAWCDYDKDGDQDVFIATHGKNKNMFFTNNGNTNKWINIKLTGTASNKNAIGARVYVTALINGTRITQMREMISNSGFGSQDEMAAVFGLGDASVIDSIVIKWPSGLTKKVTNQACNKFLVLTEDNHSTASGVVFNDKNNNGTKDAGENGIANVKVKANGATVTYTDNNGNYSFAVYPAVGNYTITQESPLYWSQSAPAANGGHAISVTAAAQTFTNRNFGLVPASAGKDLFVDVDATSLRRGFKNDMLLTYGNKGTLAGSFEVITLTLDPSIILVSASTPWSIKSGNTYTWNITAIPEGSVQTITLVDSVNLTKPTGTLVNISATITNNNDLNPLDNTKLLIAPITGPIDPNDIIANPDPIGKNRFIAHDQELTYRIRFQNVGSAPVYIARLFNTIPSDLDMNTFKVKRASHLMRYEISGNDLTFIFENINLPDSTTDEAGSHGFVEYTILPNAHLPEGTAIDNQAAIVFDYEEPVITNKLTHVISYFNSDSRYLSVYPNPVSNNTVVKLMKLAETDKGLISACVIYTETGIEVYKQEQVFAEEVSLDKTNLKPGKYYLKVMDNNGAVYTEKILIE